MFAFGFWAYQSGWMSLLIAPDKTKTEILPGTNMATLKLSNGKTLQLSGNKLGLKIDSDNLEYMDGSGIALDQTSAVRKEMEIKTNYFENQSLVLTTERTAFISLEVFK